jgi:hypothetical protein
MGSMARNEFAASNRDQLMAGRVSPLDDLDGIKAKKASDAIRFAKKGEVRVEGNVIYPEAFKMESEPSTLAQPSTLKQMNQDGIRIDAFCKKMVSECNEKKENAEALMEKITEIDKQIKYVSGNEYMISALNLLESTKIEIKNFLNAEISKEILKKEREDVRRKIEIRRALREKN